MKRKELSDSEIWNKIKRNDAFRLKKSELVRNVVKMDVQLEVLKDGHQTSSTFTGQGFDDVSDLPPSIATEDIPEISDFGDSDEKDSLDIRVVQNSKSFLDQVLLKFA